MKILLSSGRILALCFVFTLGLMAASGCGTTGGQAGTEWRSFSGETVWVPRGREGFWGIETREFGPIDPRYSLPQDYHRKGIPVTGELLLRGDMGSIRSWGEIAEIRNLQRSP